jgi:DNA-binding transcriptional ArsR family regulator
MKLYTTQVQYFKILMHPTRLAILDMLRDEEQCVCHMEAVFGLRQAHISQHLMVLREAGLVSDRRDGWNIYYRVVKPEIYPVIEAMNAFSGAAHGNPFKDELEKHKHSCPCPKCNADESSTRTEVVVLSPDVIKTRG